MSSEARQSACRGRVHRDPALTFGLGGTTSLRRGPTMLAVAEGVDDRNGRLLTVSGWEGASFTCRRAVSDSRWCQWLLAAPRARGEGGNGLRLSLDFSAQASEFCDVSVDRAEGPPNAPHTSPVGPQTHRRLVRVKAWNVATLRRAPEWPSADCADIVERRVCGKPGDELIELRGGAIHH